jgi:serine phosphatase RsbU (regulator of sigma subunit)
LLVLYTDGLTEATRDVFEGERRLRAALARQDVVRSARPAAAIGRAVAAESNDDVAILTVRVSSADSRES